MTPESNYPDQTEHAVTNSPEGVLQKKPKKRKTIILLSVIAAVVVVVVVIVVMILNSILCDKSGCNRLAISGGSFCGDHTCQMDGCMYYAGDGLYCSDHGCDYFDCGDLVVEGTKACSRHICKAIDCNQVMAFYSDSGYCDDHFGTIQFCKEDGCYEVAQEETGRCSAHSINMRERLTSPKLSFTLDSAGRIEINFSATNSTTKTIKYIRFKVYYYNAVGDAEYDEIGYPPKNYGQVEIIGPVEGGQEVNIYNEYVGYCDTLHKIVISEISIEYMDGTTEKGMYDLSYEK